MATPLNSFEISSRTLNALDRAGIETLEQLGTKTRRDLKLLLGVGSVALMEITRVLREQKAFLAPEGSNGDEARRANAAAMVQVEHSVADLIYIVHQAAADCKGLRYKKMLAEMALSLDGWWERAHAEWLYMIKLEGAQPPEVNDAGAE